MGSVGRPQRRVPAEHGICGYWSIYRPAVSQQPANNGSTNQIFTWLTRMRVHGIAVTMMALAISDMTTFVSAGEENKGFNQFAIDTAIKGSQGVFMEATKKSLNLFGPALHLARKGIITAAFKETVAPFVLAWFPKFVEAIYHSNSPALWANNSIASLFWSAALEAYVQCPVSPILHPYDMLGIMLNTMKFRFKESRSVGYCSSEKIAYDPTGRIIKVLEKIINEGTYYTWCFRDTIDIINQLAMWKEGSAIISSERAARRAAEAYYHHRIDMELPLDNSLASLIKLATTPQKTANVKTKENQKISSGKGSHKSKLPGIPSASNYIIPNATSRTKVARNEVPYNRKLTKIKPKNPILEKTTTAPNHEATVVPTAPVPPQDDMQINLPPNDIQISPLATTDSESLDTIIPDDKELNIASANS